MTRGSRNSFQVQMKKKTSSTPIVGRLTGTTIRHSTCHLLAPSIRAASMISRGNWLSTDERRYVPNAAWITVKTMMTLNLVSYRPTCLLR